MDCLVPYACFVLHGTHYISLRCVEGAALFVKLEHSIFERSCWSSTDHLNCIGASRIHERLSAKCGRYNNVMHSRD